MCHIMSQLLEFVKSKSDSHTNSENKENSSDSNFETENVEIPRNDSCPLPHPVNSVYIAGVNLRPAVNCLYD